MFPPSIGDVPTIDELFRHLQRFWHCSGCVRLRRLYPLPHLLRALPQVLPDGNRLGALSLSVAMHSPSITLIPIHRFVMFASIDYVFIEILSQASLLLQYLAFPVESF